MSPFPPPRFRARPWRQRSRRLLSAAALLLALLSGSVGARAETDPLRVARYNFEYGKYDETLALVNELVAQKLIAEGPDLIEAQRLLGLSHFYMGRRDEARAAFVNLLLLEPDFTLDPLLVPPLAIVEFEAVKQQNEGLLASIRERRRLIAEQQRLEEETRRRLLEDESRRRRERDSTVAVRHVERHSYAVNFAPVGLGQFEQRRPAMGALFASTQVLGLGAAAFSYFRVAGKLDHRTADGGWRADLSRETLDGLKWTHYAGLALAVLSYAGGVTDALLHHQDETVTFSTVPRESLLPRPATAAPPPQADLYFSPLPGGASAGLTVTF